jgi:hypothetical protein
MELLQLTKNTRGVNSRPVTFGAIGRFLTRVINREKDAEGNDLGKDEGGNQITRAEEVQEFTHAGAITSIDEAIGLCSGNLQEVLDHFAVGFNKASYQAEAGKDELDELLSGLGMDEDKLKAFKAAVRKVMAVTGKDAISTVEMLTA